MARAILTPAVFRTAARAHWRHHCTRISAPANDLHPFHAVEVN